ncbi:hypothetical protein H4217_006842 [Coemansia sp. RSA 1939]|nr:hypothetical protein H4217_006842 [Coemansia sp. RSA 1939]KAJ2616538.1 hypothetical protein EV177_001034 [Coemansia sp. RSA 1804]
MSKNEKVLAVGVPETLNLKAEIERATTESRQSSTDGIVAKRRSGSSAAVDNNNNNNNNNNNRGVHKRAQKDLLARAAEAQHSTRHGLNMKIKSRLEEKARIYDMLSTTGRTKDGDSSGPTQLDDTYITKILGESPVDFAHKQVEWQRSKKHKRHSDSETSSSSFSTSNGSDSDSDSAHDDSDSSLVEIVDEFGRSRMVHYSKRKKYARESYRSISDDDSTTSLSSSDDYRAHEGHEPSSSRYRGTSYYKLSSDSAKRSEQLGMLRRLHEDTTEARDSAVGDVVERQQSLLAKRREDILTSRIKFYKSENKD